MRQANVEDRVVVRVDVPETPICRGALGVVCSRWSAPYEVLEVEFITQDQGVVRLMIEAQNVDLLDEPTSGLPTSDLPGSDAVSPG